MSKILGSWSGMRKYLEKEMLTESLKGRVRYGCTTYKGMDGCCIFELFVDGTSVKRFSLETVNSYFAEKGYKENNKPGGISEYWNEFWTLLDKYPINERTEYTDEEFCKALEKYRNQDIEVSIRTDNPLIRMFAIFDRRIGKRTLNELREESALQPLWLWHLYNIRIASEHIT